MRRKFRSLLGSQRTSYFKEAKSAPTKHRSQNVRFRRRYASSIVTEWGSKLWTLTKTTVVLGGIGASVYYGAIFWNTSPWLRINQIIFLQPPPASLPAFLSLKTGQNIFLFNGTDLEHATLQKFKEIKSISLHRHFNRDVSVEIKFRQPMAQMELAGKLMGVDEDGIFFPITEANPTVQNPPQLVGFGPGRELKGTMTALSTMFREQSDFYFLIKILKTDRMQPLRLVLKKEIVIYWGEMNDTTVVGKAKKVLQVLNVFEPRKNSASLRFVDNDRLVMDAHWMTKKKGGQLGKT